MVLGCPVMVREAWGESGEEHVAGGEPRNFSFLFFNLRNCKSYVYQVLVGQ